MMTPEMMQMRQLMVGQDEVFFMMRGRTGKGMSEDGAGPGMTSRGQKPGSGMIMCPMMQMMMSGQAGMGMPGMMAALGNLIGPRLAHRKR